MQSESDASRSLAQNGYLVLNDVIPVDLVTKTVEFVKANFGQSSSLVNLADILSISPDFLEFLDLDQVLSIVTAALGSNIYVNHTHLNYTPATGLGRSGYGWHRDGGIINQDLGPSGPMLSVKVAFYLTDVLEEGSGETLVIPGSHLTGENVPDNSSMPVEARRVLVPKGTAVIYDRRIVHSLRSPNTSARERIAIFVQYAYRWMAPVDRMTPPDPSISLTPTRRQLLGMLDTERAVGGAQGRSTRYYPDALASPIGSSRLARLVASLKRVLKG